MRGGPEPSQRVGSNLSGRAEQAAFRAFYDRHLANVLHFLRFQVKDEDRPDVASRTFEIAARDFHKFVVPPGKERERAERNWLLTIARNAAASFRQQARQSEQIDEETLEAPGDPERETAAFELAVALLWTLPEHLRTLYLLHERDGLTHEEIAEQLAFPLGTVKTQLRAAQEQLDATIARMCARERTRRGDYLRGVPLPFVEIGGLIEALRNVEEDVDQDVADHIRDGAQRRSVPAAPPVAPPPLASPPTAGTVTAGASAGARAVRGIAGGKLVAALLAAAAGGAALVSLVRPSAPGVAPLVVQAEATAARSADVAAAASTGSGAATVTNQAAAPAATATSSATADGFRTEGDAIQAARNAFASGDFARAIKLADQHAKRYPGGSFVAEREAIAIRALAQLGRTAQARARAETFRRVFPNSVFRGAVDAATGGSHP